MKKNILKPIAYICTGLGITAISYAGIQATAKVPTRPSIPFVIKAWENGGVLRFRSPKNDGGSPVTNYLIETKNEWDWRWKYKGISKDTLYTLRMPEKCKAQFRVRAINAVGMGEVSPGNDPITFRNY